MAAVSSSFTHSQSPCYYQPVANSQSKTWHRKRAYSTKPQRLHKTALSWEKMNTCVSNNIQNHYWRESSKSLAIFKSHTESQKASCYWNGIISVDSNKTRSPLFNFGGCPCVGCSECYLSTCLEGCGRSHVVTGWAAHPPSSGLPTHQPPHRLWNLETRSWCLSQWRNISHCFVKGRAG